MRAMIVVAAAALAVSGCEKAGPKDRVEKSKLYVLDEGTGDKRELRYEIPEGSSQRLDFVMDTTMNMSGAGMPGGDMVLPRMTMATTISVDKVDAKGGMHFAMVTDDFTVSDRPGAMAGVSSAMAGPLAAMRGLRMTGTLMPDGKTREMKVDESTVDPSVRDALKTTEQSIDQMTALLPDVPVGVGARWRVEQTLRSGGIRMNQVATYELTALTATGATITADVDMDAPAQSIKQNGMSVRLDRMSGRGAFTTQLAFDKMVDRVAGTISMDMDLSAAGQRVSMSMQLALDIHPQGAAAEVADD
ncbi:MAG: hypothetical protein H6709_01320 [Kofleriaceae bacterium]|nr:hypothetical protein [Myxococcales bacterium]MCB9570709.1 hypothetical protein [Kofleriaceae bacterium]